MIEQGQILVVDDNVVNRKLLQRILEDQGHRVTLAESGVQALAALAEAEVQVDVVLLDIVMPDLDGYATLAAIKATPALRHLPVLMISAVDEIDSVLRCIELGAVDYLPKPFNPVILMARINAGLRQKQLYAAEQRALRALERELEIGRQIQFGFLPDVLPQPEGWEIAAHFQAAREVAGDFYDAFELPGGMIGLVIADVCGKGVGAALFMTLFRSLLRATSDVYSVQGWPLTTAEDAGVPPHLIRLRQSILLTNNYIARTHERAAMFATIFFGVLDPVSGELSYINAGHEPPLILGPDGVRQALGPSGPVVGLFPDLEFRLGRATLEPGDILLAVTDGVTDALDAEGAFFTRERLLALLEPPFPGAAALLGKIDAALGAYSGAASQFDDITMLAARRHDPGVR